ncbi:MAG TPA: ATP-binding protein [Opitutaceae bacterium]|jgi:hypothetical protein|nr:ATP-binding protein [Opitutaceae bacterium]
MSIAAIPSLPITTTADFEVGPQAISAYSRLSYSIWYALAEFVDNSTQSRMNYDGIVNEVLAQEGKSLTVEIKYDRENREIIIEDNSIGMTKEDLIAALKIGQPTPDSKGRSKYGMGLKTASCWIGANWSVTTCEYAKGEEWTATVDVDAVARGATKIPLACRQVSTDLHYTRVRIWNLHRVIQRRTEDVITAYLGAIYREDIRNKQLILLFNQNQVTLPEEHELARTEDGKEAREVFETTVGGKQVKGWFAVLKTGSRKLGGFSLMQNNRQIRGYPDAWKPKSVFGGEDDEGGNSLVSQRLIGEIVLDGFEVSHTKDEILYRGTEEEELENFLSNQTKRLKQFASVMRKGTKGTPWSAQKFKELLDSIKEEFSSSEIKDVVTTTPLPPLSVIQDSIKKQAAAVKVEEELLTMDVGGITVIVCLQDRSENDPYLTIYPNPKGELMIIINQQHPYYLESGTTERADELTRQFIYDGVAEYMVGKKCARVEPDAVRKYKDQLLRAKITRLHNRNTESQEQEQQKLGDVPTPAANTPTS